MNVTEALNLLSYIKELTNVEKEMNKKLRNGKEL